jgi:D-threonine aldolase
MMPANKFLITMQQEDQWYKIENEAGIDTPALVVYPQRIKENIRLLVSMIDDPSRLRPHVKTNKTREATLLMLEAGIRKFKCATIAEAEMLAMCQAPDVLLAYQPVGPKLLRLVTLIKQYPATQFSCLTDHLDAAIPISEAACAHQLLIPVYIDLNTGMNRTGIAPGPQALALYEQCLRLPGIRVLGLHAYDGHIRGVDYEKRSQECNAAFAPVEGLAQAIKEKGYAEPQIIAGGSPTFPIHAQRKAVQCSPGTFIYWDKGYRDTLPEQKFLPAALVLTRVISLPDKTHICLDLGHKAVASENPLPRRVFFLNAPDLVFISQSEEHLVVAAPAGHHLQVGQVLYGLPYHICPTCNLYDSVVPIEAGMANGSWQVIARDRKISI